MLLKTFQTKIAMEKNTSFCYLACLLNDKYVVGNTSLVVTRRIYHEHFSFSLSALSLQLLWCGR